MFFNSALHKMGVPHRLPVIPPEFVYMHIQTLPDRKEWGEWTQMTGHRDYKKIKRGKNKVIKEKPNILPKPRKQRPKIWEPHYNADTWKRYYDKVKNTDEYKAKKKEINDRPEVKQKRLEAVRRYREAQRSKKREITNSYQHLTQSHIESLL